jgi:hypothetical protein
MVHSASFSTTLGFLNNMDEKCETTTPSAIEVKSQQKTISSEDKLRGKKPT